MKLNPNHATAIVLALTLAWVATFCGQRPDIDASGLKPALANPETTNR
jgi:hypothetical protein